MPHTPLIGVKVTQATRAQMDALLIRLRKRTGEEWSISRFVREAIAEKIAREEKIGSKASGGLQATG